MRFSYASRAIWTSARKYESSLSSNAWDPSTNALAGSGWKSTRTMLAPATIPCAVTCMISRMPSGPELRAPTECDGSMHTGMRVKCLTTGTWAKSTKFRWGSPMFVFMPRKPKITLRLPSLARYSAAWRDSSRLIPKPRFSSIGNSCCRPALFSNSKFCVFRVPICNITPVALPVMFSASWISSMCDSCVTSIAMILIPYLPASSKT